MARLWVFCSAKAGPIQWSNMRYAMSTSLLESTYRVTRELPSPVRDELPTVEDLEALVTKLRKEMKQQRDREET